MKKKIISVLTSFVLTCAIAFVGLANVNAADTITYKSSSNTGHGVAKHKTSAGTAYCMIHGVSGPSKNAKMTLAATYTSGPILYIVNDTAISGTGDKGYTIRQKALWRYLNSIDSKTFGDYKSITGDYKDQAKKLFNAAKAAGNSYTINPTITSVTTPSMTKSGAYYTSQKITVGMKDVTGNSYSVSYAGAPSGTTTINKSGNTFQVRVPVSSVTKTTTFTVNITGANSPYKYVKRYHYAPKKNEKRKQDMGLLVSTSKTPTGSAKATVTFQKCHIVGSTYYGSNGNVVTQDQYYAQCNPHCAEKDGKYYNNVGKPVTQQEYYVACNPQCKEENGKYYDANHKPVTQAEYYLSCNPKCQFKDNVYYNKVGKPVTQDEYFKDCFTVTPPPTPAKAVDTRLIRYEQNYSYTIKHEVPHRIKAEYFKSYVFTDVLEEPLQIKDVKDVKIYQSIPKAKTEAEKEKANNEENKESGNTTEEQQDVTKQDIQEVNDDIKMEDWTEKFDIKIEGQKITATLKDPSDPAFYGTRTNDGVETNKVYSYVLTVSLRDNAETKYDMSKYKTEDGYVIPDVATVDMVTFDDKKETQETNKVEVEYRLAPPPTKNVNQENVTASYVNGTKFEYTINKQVLNYEGNQRFSSFVFKDTFEDPIQISSPNDLKVVNELGEDVTSWFDVKVNGQTLTASLKKENYGDKFYGHTYTFIASVNVKKGYNLNKYKDGNRYIIPNYATVTYDGKIEKTDVVYVYVEIQEKVIKTPDTASPADVIGIIAGVVLISGAAYAICLKNGIDPLKSLRKTKKQVNN